MNINLINNYVGPTKGYHWVESWLFSTNCQNMSILYGMFSLFSGLVGLSLSVLMRIELSSPNPQMLMHNGQLWNVLMTAHALFMVFYLVMPMTMGALANYLVPLQMGSNDTAFPRMNNLAFVVLLPSMLFAVLSCLIDEGPGSGWTLKMWRSKMLTDAKKTSPLFRNLLNYSLILLQTVKKFNPMNYSYWSNLWNKSNTILNPYLMI
uniref:Cytochrome c oxidase subunit 1 n=1 Tax=Starmerella bacillaris TaxID=1247836 RepID=Q6ED49_STABA|nr:cox1-i1a protein [Starmerella bacillaris]AAR10351.2 cox1-i1a protein [Starmerella bacillaris]